MTRPASRPLAATVRAQDMQKYDLSALEIVVVDDSYNMVALLDTMLKSIGVRKVELCHDAAAALAKIKDAPPDIVITDWNMEPISGIDFLRQIRSDSGVEDGETMPVIMLTGHTELEKVIEARDAGVTSYLMKPVTARALYERIVHIIESDNQGEAGPRKPEADAAETWSAG